jgi:hypothetical protein
MGGGDIICENAWHCGHCGHGGNISREIRQFFRVPQRATWHCGGECGGRESGVRRQEAGVGKKLNAQECVAELVELAALANSPRDRQVFADGQVSLVAELGTKGKLMVVSCQMGGA